MADNIGYTPGTGAIVAADEIGGVLHQRVKLGVGADGVAVDVSADNPMPVELLGISQDDPLAVIADRADNLLAMLQRLLKTLESNATVDQQQRQRITLDAITGALTLATVTTVGTVSSITAGTLTAVNNLVANAGMDREQYINIARNTYANAIRSQLTFQ